ncbi:hypothetical protein R3P38DRAFT_3470669 [Favolaschia claudopus]|uniref:Uncharacterized protein n=1 Tax=Favolaschia claudopus TaxID=2862362 RepID=A0AAV9ZD47_9AGAR
MVGGKESRPVSAEKAAGSETSHAVLLLSHLHSPGPAHPAAPPVPASQSTAFPRLTATLAGVLTPAATDMLRLKPHCTFHQPITAAALFSVTHSVAARTIYLVSFTPAPAARLALARSRRLTTSLFSLLVTLRRRSRHLLLSLPFHLAPDSLKIIFPGDCDPPALNRNQMTSAFPNSTGVKFAEGHKVNRRTPLCRFYSAVTSPENTGKLSV